MLRQIEGSRGVAEAVALARPEVICAYPISPQTHIVEALGVMVKTGALSPCEFINVESEFAAMSVAIGASATGARAYTATASQGLLYMAEAVFNAAGLGLPIVMTVANRAIGAPINIWNDHSDSMALRDSGWIQLHAESNQEALDLHIQAFRIAAALSLPVMVCMDGFILTHATERVDVPTQREVDDFLPSFVPRQVLDPDAPVTIGAMVGPEAFMEVRYLAHLRHLEAIERVADVSAAFATRFGRQSGGLVTTDGVQGADTVVVSLGSVLGTIRDAVDELRDAGARVGVVGIGCYRPFPFEAVRAAAGAARRIVVIEKSLAPGTGGVVATDVWTALAHMPGRRYSVIAGLGGRPITRRSIVSLLQRAAADELEPLTFLDLDQQVVQRELARADRRLSRERVETALAVGGRRS